MLTEAFNVNLESLITKEYPESRLDARFSEQKAYIDSRFAEQDAHFDKRLVKVRTDLSEDISSLRLEMREGFAQIYAKVDGNFRIILWSQAIVVTAVIIPLLQNLMN